MSIRCPESNRAKDAGQKGGVIVVQVLSLQLSPLMQFGDHVKTQDVGLSLLQSSGLFLERLSNGALTGNGVLDSQSVGDLMEHNVGEEGIEVDVALLLGGDQLSGNGEQNLVELGSHGIFQLKPAGSLPQLDLL